MARDALDPGPDGTFPNWPRRADGTPDERRMPTGTHKHRQLDRSRRKMVVDVTPRHPDGTPIVPPTLGSLLDHHEAPQHGAAGRTSRRSRAS